MIRFGVLSGAILVAAAAGAAAEEGRELVVIGQGRVEAVPDIATVTAGVETQAEEAAVALAEGGAAMRAILEALEAAGIARADIQTSHIALEPVYRQRSDRDGIIESPEVVGYIARNILTVQVRAVEAVGTVLDDISDAGVNRIMGIAFRLAEPRVHEDAARAAAVRDAREKAALLAEAAEVELGPILSLRETMPFDRPFPMQARAEMAMDGAIAEGSIEVTAMVELVYTLND
jgi:uncharacterized protein